MIKGDIESFAFLQVCGYLPWRQLMISFTCLGIICFHRYTFS